jgi:hypothetical protein
MAEKIIVSYDGNVSIIFEQTVLILVYIYISPIFSAKMSEKIITLVPCMRKALLRRASSPSSQTESKQIFTIQLISWGGGERLKNKASCGVYTFFEICFVRNLQIKL